MQLENITSLSKENRYNWRKIWKEVERLGIPDFVYNPIGLDMNKQAYIMDISERSTGKTTSWLLTALVINKMYGDTFAYLRQTKPQIAPKNCGKVFETIKKCGYIDKLTDGKYKDIYLWGGVFRYCNRDDTTQKVIEESEPIGYALCVEDSEIYKSNFNVPNCNIVIFDEFISTRHIEDEFLKFTDILSTVGRQRIEFYVVLLANTLNVYNKYLEEFGVSRELRKMSFGEHRLVTSGMVKIYVNLISMEEKRQTKIGQIKRSVTLWRFGFNNSKLSSITGDSWNIKQYPHIPSFVDVKKDKKYGMFLVSLSGDTIKGELFKTDGHQYILFSPYRTTKYKGDIRRYTLEQPNTLNERYGQGWDKVDNIIWSVILGTDRVFFSVNECGLILDEYIERCNTESFI